MVMPWKEKIKQSHSWVTNGECVCERESCKRGREKEICFITWVLQSMCAMPPSVVFDLLRVGSESYVPPGVHRPIRLLFHQRESDGVMRETHRETEWLTMTEAKTGSENVCVWSEILFVVQMLRFSIDGRIFKMDVKFDLSPFLSLCTSLQHVQLRWYVYLSADIFTMQIFSLTAKAQW